MITQQLSDPSAQRRNLARITGAAGIIAFVVVLGTSLANGYQSAEFTSDAEQATAFFRSLDDWFGAFSAFLTSIGLIAMMWFAIGLALLLRRYDSELPWRSSFLAGSGLAARWGLRLLIVGSVIGVVAHLASLPFVDAKFEDIAALGAVFGIGALLATVGFLMAGVGTVRTHHWTGLFRWTPLGIGIVGVALMFLQFTPLLPTGVGLYYLGFVPLGLAVAGYARTETRA